MPCVAWLNGYPDRKEELDIMNTWRLEIVSPEKYCEWFEANWPKLKYRSPFHHPAWLETVARGINFKTGYMGFYEGRELVAVMPGFRTRRGPFRLYGSPLRGTMTSHLGPVGLKPLWTDQNLMELLEACTAFVRKTWGGVYFRFSLPEAPASNLPVKRNWQNQNPGTYISDLSMGREELWKGLKSDCRRNVRRAQDAGMEVVPFDDARLFYYMIDQTFRRHNSTSWHKEVFFQLLFDELISKDLLWSRGVKYEGKIIAAALFLHDDQDVIFISGASLPEYGSLPTSYLLHWNAIEIGVQMGLKAYHSDRSRVPSIDQFKESFRPVLQKRYTLIWAPGYVRSAERVFLLGVARLRQLNSLLDRKSKHA